MVTRIWHGATPATKSDEYLTLMRTVAIPDYRSTPGNKGAYALRRVEGDTAHFLMVTFWESEDAIRALPETISAWRNTTISTRISCLS
jgi:heme-degrading monooxygenase HmoA